MKGVRGASSRVGRHIGYCSKCYLSIATYDEGSTCPKCGNSIEHLLDKCPVEGRDRRIEYESIYY